MNRLLVSIIIPVYRAAGCIEACTESILNQAPAQSELILVDDGSPDESGAICDRIARLDHRVRVIHQRNGGASAARNAGLEAAAGEWIQFVDADDSLLPGLYGASMPYLQDSELDLIVFGIRPCKGQAKPLPAGRWQSLAQMPSPEKVVDDLLIRDGALVAPYGKFYRRSRVADLRFDKSLKVNEDYLFNARFLAVCGPLVFIPESFYLYDNTNAASISHQVRGDVLDMESYTRPALESLAKALQLSQSKQQALLDSRRIYTYICQFDILVGQKGSLSLARRTELTRQIFSQADVRSALLQRYRTTDRGVLSLPYRFCLKINAPRLLAAYCALKNHFL